MKKPSDCLTGIESGSCLMPVKRLVSPVYVLVIITASIFLAETVINVFFDNSILLLPAAESLLKALFMIVVIFPALYLLMLKPMRTYVKERDNAVEVLRESEGKFRNLADNSPNMIFINQKGKVVYANKICAEITGYAIDEICSSSFNFMLLIAPECINMVNENLRRHMKGEDVPAYECVLITKDGGRVESIINTRLIKYSGENAILGVITDITEYKKAGAELIERDGELRAVIESSADGILVVDGLGQVIHTNRNFAEMWRIPEELIKTKSDEKLINHVLGQLKDPQAFLTKVLSLYESMESSFDTLLFKDGRVFERYSRPLIIGGKIAGRVWTFRDVTERRRSEETVLQIAKGVSATVGEKFFYSLAGHLSNILGADYAYVAEIIPGRPNHVRTLSLIADGKVIDNIEVYLAGTPCEGVLENKCCSYPSGIRDKFPEAHMMAMMNVEGYVGTTLTGSSGNSLGLMAVMYRRPVKNVAVVESTLQIFASRASAEIERRHAEIELNSAKEEIEKWNGELEARIREKTDELQKSQAQIIQAEKLSAMGRLAAGLAHELNSPLAGLLPLLAKYRERAEKDTLEHKELSLMLKACEHMAKIIRDFGSFSRGKEGEYARLNLNDIIEDTLSFSAGHVKKSGIRIITEYADGLPEVLGDKTELQQVILNMMTNARDAMRSGGKLILKTGVAADNKVVLEFVDDGDGIEKENLDKIFDPFFTTKKSGEGTGLGLSVSYGIIKKHNGEIYVESEQGKGAKFTVLLPAINK